MDVIDGAALSVDDARRFNMLLVNACILVFGWTGLMVMDEMRNAEDRATTVAIMDETKRLRQEVRVWKEATTKKNLAIMTQEFDCKPVAQPFLTNFVVVTNDLPNLEWMSYDDTLAATSTGTYDVVAYCQPKDMSYENIMRLIKRVPFSG